MLLSPSNVVRMPSDPLSAIFLPKSCFPNVVVQDAVIQIFRLLKGCGADVVVHMVNHPRGGRAGGVMEKGAAQNSDSLTGFTVLGVTPDQLAAGGDLFLGCFGIQEQNMGGVIKRGRKSF